MSTKTETPQGVGTEDLLGEIARLQKELADEKSDHADTQAKWNEALDKGLALLAENEKLHEEAMRHKGLLRLEELARMAERRACEALEAENRGLADEIVKLTNELLEAQERNRAFSSPNNVLASTQLSFAKKP